MSVPYSLAWAAIQSARSAGVPLNRSLASHAHGIRGSRVRISRTTSPLNAITATWSTIPSSRTARTTLSEMPVALISITG